MGRLKQIPVGSIVRLDLLDFGYGEVTGLTFDEAAIYTISHLVPDGPTDKVYYQEHNMVFRYRNDIEVIWWAEGR